MPESADFYIGKFITVYAINGKEFHGTLINIDKYGNMDLVGRESPEGDKFKFTIMRQHIVAIGTVLEKII